jgi:hypothetical protein
LSDYCAENDIIFNENHDEFRLEFHLDKQFYFNKLKHQVFLENATMHGNFYNHFGISKISAALYGDEVSDIDTVEITFAEDQTIDARANEYWGFYDFERSKLSLIYAAYVLLDMCFAYGVNAAEHVKHSRFAVKLDVKFKAKAYA